MTTRERRIDKIPGEGGPFTGWSSDAVALWGGGEEGLEVKGAGVHGEVAGGVGRPLVAGAVPVELDTVEVGVVEVEGFADAVVGGTVEWTIGGNEAAEGVGQCGAGGVEDGEVIKAGGARCGRLAAQRFPGIEADVMVVAARGEESRGVTEALGEFEAKDAIVEGEGAVKIGNAKVNVADGCLGMDGGSYGCIHGVGRPLVKGGSSALASRATFHFPSTFFQKVK